jgi:tRNA (mo5U34)-methyltransferase
VKPTTEPDGRQSSIDATGQVWYHTINFPDGTVTPGVFDTRRVADLVRWPPGLAGGRCLDVGTCDGFWAFEMERRGAAEVIAADVNDLTQLDLTWDARQRDGLAQASGASVTSRRGRFEIARHALGSRVERLECSVYELDPSKHGRFGVVFCGTLLVHLRDPIRALERMREVCAGELVVVECVDAFLGLAGRWTPSARLAPVPGQWWRANKAGLIKALELAGFDVVSISRPFLTPLGPGARIQASGRRRRLTAVRAAAGRWPGLSSIPFLVDLMALAGGSYDVAIRAQPRGPVST